MVINSNGKNSAVNIGKKLPINPKKDKKERIKAKNMGKNRNK